MTDRRDAVARLVAAFQDPAGARRPLREGTPPERPRVPVNDLVNVFEFEEQARLSLTAALFARVAGSDRSAFDRTTLRPRVMVPTTDLDLGLTLFGQSLYAPIIVGPIADHRQYHADGELGTVTGATAAHTPVVVTSRSTTPIESLAGIHDAQLWYQVFATEESARAKAQQAVAAGCRVVCITVGATWPAGATRATALSSTRDWDLLATVRRDIAAPVLVKGVMTPESARVALQHEPHGIVVSNYGGLLGGARESSLLGLRRVVEAVDGKVPVLIDGGFRRGTDILKALALGARGVMVARPIMWGLSSYGAAGVQAVLEMLHLELARYMCMSGAAHLGALEPAMVRTHRA